LNLAQQYKYNNHILHSTKYFLPRAFVYLQIRRQWGFSHHSNLSIRKAVNWGKEWGSKAGRYKATSWIDIACQYPLEFRCPYCGSNAAPFDHGFICESFGSENVQWMCSAQCANALKASIWLGVKEDILIVRRICKLLKETQHVKNNDYSPTSQGSDRGLSGIQSWELDGQKCPYTFAFDAQHMRDAKN
jgi:hypothetical protein